MSESAKILIVDDDPRVCRLLSHYLVGEGYRIDIATDGTAMWELLAVAEPDLVLLDLMLPGVDGITLARELRARSPVGIIILTGKDNPTDTVVGLEVGADDYITKPFDNRELLARIRSVLRRTVGQGRNPASARYERGAEMLKFDGWEMNLSLYQLVSPAGETVSLTNQEFRLLEYLVVNAKHVLSRDQILQKLSHRDWQPEDRSVDVLIAKLRKMIEENPAQPKFIRTIRNVGYQFTAEVENL